MAPPPESPDAKTEATANAFLREVEEELSYDRLMGFFRNHGRKALMLLLAGLAAFAAWLWWQSHQADVAGQQGEQFSAIVQDIQSGKTADVSSRLAALGNNGNEGYRASSKLLSASIALEKGDIANAVAGFKAVANDTSFDQAWRDTALIRQTAAEYDSLSSDTVITRLKPLAVAGKPWYGSAGEMIGMAYLKSNKTDLAAQTFAALAKNKTVPDTISSRARQMASSLGVDVSDSVTKEKAE